jgi:multidrug resistance efflux pump
VRRWLLALVLCACTKGHGDLPLVEVKRADLVIGVEVSGELAAVDSTDIKPPSLPNVWNFKVASLATEGADIKEGDPAAGFDPSELMRELETMQNDADAAKKKLDKKKDDAALARRDEELAIAEAEAGLRKASLKTTMPDDLVASVEAKVVALDVQLAQMHVEQAKAKSAAAKRSDAAEIAKLADHHAYLEGRVKELQANIMKMDVKAPRGGTVVYPTNWRGEKTKVGDPAWRGMGVIQIVGLGKMVGNGEVDEIDVARIAVGQAVSIRLDALPDVKVVGTVESIAKAVGPKSQADPSNIVKLKIKIDASKDVPLRPGMRFRGQVDTEKLANVLQIPADAVFVTPDGPVAYKADGDDVAKVKVQVGKRNATTIEIVSGLSAGDRVSRIDPDRSEP